MRHLETRHLDRRSNIIRFGADGWQARLDDGFDEAGVRRVADSLGLLWAEAHPGATVLVGYDTRHNSAEYARAAACVLASFGLRAVVSDRPCPTPVVSWCCSRRDDAVGVVMLTASERSCEYGGLIVRGADGGPVSREFLDTVEQHISLEPPTDCGELRVENFIDPYLDDLVTLVDGAAIAAATPSVIVDPMYGAGTGVLANALERLGCNVTEIHAGPCEDFCGLHPEPADPWADECEETVSSTGADMGFLLDCDGDRAGVVDENGNILLPHELSPLVLGHLVENRGESGRVIVTLTCSARIARQAERLGCQLTSVPVGFSRIYREMLEGDVLLGAEEYGGLAFPSHLLERDGLLACLLVVELAAKSGRTVRQLVSDMGDKIGHMRYTRRDVRLDPAATQAFRNVLPGLNPGSVAGRRPVEVSHADGLRLQFDDGSWVLMRPSRSDPVVRVYSEAPTEGERDRLLDASCGMVRAGA
ncbi:phosphoglucomutase [Tractidigestivibacter scatoligenes]|uniref:Phosphoglucomutase n=1 Tax=Tractidigestivibacter scatoligenes TaxID=1299998 RepID=A0A117J4Q8_TRASO|nr:phosphoglucomutase [Tractidigestivibacter scatoligenes]